MNPILLYRISNILFINKVPLIPRVIKYFIRLVFSCYLPYRATIGRKVKLGYGGLGIVIHDRSIIGDNCYIDQNVTIGGTSKKFNVPIIGNNVYIGAGAKILGPVTIGNNVVIGANAVVVKNIPSNSLAVGIPARVIKTGIQMSDYV